MTYVDIHSHLDFKDFDKDRIQIVNKMKECNIITLTNTLNQDNFEYTKQLFKDHKSIVKVCPGLYPQDAEKINDKDFEDYLKQIKKEDPIAIGEVGLDKKWTKDENLFQIQVKRFEKLIELAIEIDKPIIIHTRQAEVEVLEVIRKYKNKHPDFNKYVLHCFSGKKKLIKEIKELKVYCSIPLTVVNTQSFQILAQELAITQLLVETDSPFLNPEKVRNSPLNIPIIYSEIARIKGYDKKEIENIIFRNYMRLIM